jgi:hypothetical protein
MKFGDRVRVVGALEPAFTGIEGKIKSVYPNGKCAAVVFPVDVNLWPAGKPLILNNYEIEVLDK